MDSGNVWKGLAFGGIASCVAEMATLPIDVVKTRMQLQGELGAARQYSGSLDALVKVPSTQHTHTHARARTPRLLQQQCPHPKPCLTIDSVAHQVARSEGVTALWKGVQPALLRQATYGSMRCVVECGSGCLLHTR